MREIKFRAWDKKNKVMLNNVAVSINGKCAVSNEDIFELQQFTGLKDKNGKEIYEGDIVKYNFRTKDSNEEFISKIFFDEYMWLTEEHSINRINNSEVIGNIFENPELIK